MATADILTLCGVLAAVWWYWRGPDDTRLSRYSVFFLMLALTSLFKGLIGFILPGLMLLGWLAMLGSLRQFLAASAFILVGSGLLVWLFARPGMHLGASGWLFGLWGLLLAQAWFQRSLGK